MKGCHTEHTEHTERSEESPDANEGTLRLRLRVTKMLRRGHSEPQAKYLVDDDNFER